MTSLLRGDLYRLVRSSTTWISLAAVIGIGLASFVAVWAPTTDAGRAAFEGATSFYDGTGGIGYLLGQLLPIWMLFVSLDASEHLSMELESGYVVSLVTIGRGSSRRWRRTVVAERLVLAALMAAVWVLAGALATCVPFAVALGIGLDGATVASLASWLALAWPLCLAYALTSLVVTWLTRSRLTGVLWAVAVGGGFVGITLGNTLGFVSPALATLASWLPGSAAKLMQAGPSLVDAREASLAFASVGSPATHVLVTAHVFTLITTIVALLVVPRRDMA